MDQLIGSHGGYGVRGHDRDHERYFGDKLFLKIIFMLCDSSDEYHACHPNVDKR